jgi:hypothetical protein
MFSRKRPRHVRSGDAPPSDALAQSLVAEGEAPAPEVGPYDVRHAPEGVQRLDLGSIQIPALEGVEVRVQASPEGVIEHVVLVSGTSGVELGAFAAPRTDGVWAEVREEMVVNMAAENLKATEVDGPYGPELLAKLPDPEGNLVDVRFVGVDGPRWFVKATFQGPVAADPASAPVLRACLEGLVVVRDDEPRPVREALPLRLPPEMAQQVPPNPEA